MSIASSARLRQAICTAVALATFSVAKTSVYAAPTDPLVSAATVKPSLLPDELAKA